MGWSNKIAFERKKQQHFGFVENYMKIRNSVQGLKICGLKRFKTDVTQEIFKVKLTLADTAATTIQTITRDFMFMVSVYSHTTF